VIILTLGVLSLVAIFLSYSLTILELVMEMAKGKACYLFARQSKTWYLLVFDLNSAL
jgi:hypothetical protein